MAQWLATFVSDTVLPLVSSVPSLPTFLLPLPPEPASTLYLIRHATSPSRLLSLIASRRAHVVADNVCLAHVRLQASKFLLAEIYATLQRLEGRATAFRLESAAIHAAARGQLRLRLPFFDANSVGRARALEDAARAVTNLRAVILQFVGMHADALDDVAAALNATGASAPQPDLARAIVASSRQASSFIGAAVQAADVPALNKLLVETLRASLAAAPSRRDALPKLDSVAGQLGKFWNQNAAPSPPSADHALGSAASAAAAAAAAAAGGATSATAAKTPLSSHDVSLTLQILQSELESTLLVGRRLRRLVDRAYGEMWDIRRRPLRYSGLAAASASTARALMLHSSTLGGSGLVEQRIADGSRFLQHFVVRNVTEPVSMFYRQVFVVDASGPSAESLAATRASVGDMLVDFTERNLSNVPGAKELAQSGSMSAVSEFVREQAASPLRNLVSGSLGQAFLLQVQKLKVDVEDLMLKSKQMIRAQELNLALVALVPSMLTLSLVAYVSSTTLLYWKSRDKAVVVSGAQTAQLLLGNVYDLLVAMENQKKAGIEPNVFVTLEHVEQVGELHLRLFELRQLVDEGILHIASKETLLFLEDLDRLTLADVPLRMKLQQIQRMLLCYRFLRNG